jgi:hypothetical protein
MSVLTLLKDINPIDRIMMAANLLFILAFLFLTKSMSFQVIEYIILGLVILSLIAIISKLANQKLQQYAVVIDVVNLVIAGFISIRYGMAFVTDFDHFVALVLFIASVCFAIVFVRSISKVVTTIAQIQAANSNSTTTTNDSDA